MLWEETSMRAMPSTGRPFARIVPSLALLIASPGRPASAQVTAGLSAGQGVEALQPVGDASEAEGNTAVAGTLAYEFVGGQARVAYDGAFGTYAAPGDWSTWAHEAGGRYRFDFGEGEAHHLHTGGSVVLRRNGSAWEAADYDALGGFVNLELHPTGTTVVRAGYRADVRRFSSSPALNHDQHTAFGSLLVSLPSRTTLVGEITTGFKRYAGLPATPALLATGTSQGTGASHGGTGTGAGQGPGWRPATTSGLALVPVTTPGTPGTEAGLLTAYLRVAQSVAERVGLSGKLFRRTLLGDAAPAVVATPPGFFDDGVYDDPFASDMTSARLSLKGLPQRGPAWLVGGTWQDKPHANTPALDAAGSPIPGQRRHDRVVRAGASLSWPIATSHTGSVEVALVPTYGFTRSRSTTSDYNYTSHLVTVGVTIGY
jgi:hypothetical protein